MSVEGLVSSLVVGEMTLSDGWNNRRHDDAVKSEFSSATFGIIHWNPKFRPCTFG